MSVPTRTLNNGLKIPQLGFGVWRVEKGEEALNAVSEALKVGYRLIDTAAVYRNEEEVGSAIKESGIPRKDIFLTTKLWNSDQGYDSTLKAFDASLERLGMDYIDLYLIHWYKGAITLESWRAMEKLYADGRVKAIGVSNFQIPHLDELAKHAETVPAINQIELHPMFAQKELRAYGAAHGIQIESWSPLMQGKTILESEIITTIAQTHDRSPAQVVLRWHLQNDLVVIPKSVTPARIKSNFELFDFELSEDEMAQIDDMDAGHRVGPNPDHVPF